MEINLKPEEVENLEDALAGSWKGVYFNPSFAVEITQTYPNCVPRPFQIWQDGTKLLYSDFDSLLSIFVFHKRELLREFL